MSSLSDPVVRRAVAQRISRLLPDHPRVWGKMSAAQMICHLNDSYLLAIGERTASSASGPLQRTVVKYLAIHIPIRWPRDIHTRPEVEQGVGGTAPADFEADRRLLLATIDRFCVPHPEIGKHDHPIFGPMSIAEWMRWGFLHADHHLRQFGV